LLDVDVAWVKQEMAPVLFSRVLRKTKRFNIKDENNAVSVEFLSISHLAPIECKG